MQGEGEQDGNPSHLPATPQAAKWQIQG